jgi:hypothetical protein
MVLTKKQGKDRKRLVFQPDKRGGCGGTPAERNDDPWPGLLLQVARL